MSTDFSAMRLNGFQTHAPARIPAKSRGIFAQQQRVIEVLSTSGREYAFSAEKYFAAAFVIGTIVIAIFPIWISTSVIALRLASWYLLSAVIIVMNRAAQGTFLEKFIHRIHAAAMEANSVITGAAVFPHTLFKSNSRVLENLRGRPILMVNGYLSFGSTWYYIKQKLIRAGFGPIYTPNIGTGRSIITYAKQLKEKVKQIQNETGRKDLILIGHSRGGLIASYYATHLAEATKTKITDVITIGSPLGGASIAYIGPGYDAYEMRPGSRLLQELREKIKKHPHIRFSRIASEVDIIVPLSSSLLGKDCSRQMVLKDIGHLGLIFSSRVADRICTWLK